MDNIVVRWSDSPDSLETRVAAVEIDLRSNTKRTQHSSNARRMLSLPALCLKQSTNNTGLGVFTVQPVRKGQYLTEYGGRQITYTEAMQLRESGHDTHIVASVFGASAIDGSVQPPLYTLDYYTRNHLVGSFINDPYGFSNSSVNCKFEYKDWTGQAADGAYITRRVFARATRDLAADQELFVNYGKTYHELHFA